ncbi:hypothetical protein JJL56_01715 [Azospirillum sp. YIM DDC1]|uniref:Uncharacterized protein n=1 Tax=Azospirillum aestuarii TaxID=2802052 RepID=A0ABS1HTF4_9PROT|nr:hypothetical protein [Azospirillum aestuarii]MBK4717578.1 hypothetical protein [Azospirillum aestuarii]
MAEGIDEEDALRTGRPAPDHDAAGKARSDRSDPERMARKLASKAGRARAALRSAPTPIGPKAAMQLARNLEPLIEALKKARPRHLKPLQDLTRRAGVSADGDEKRLSRFEDARFVERLSLSGIERALGGSVFHVMGAWGDRADRPEPGFTEAPPGMAAAHVEAGLVFGYAHPPEKAFTVRGALEDSAVHHLATFKAFMARQMEMADDRAQQAIQDFRDGPDRMRTGCFDDVDIPLQTETVEE